MEASAITFQPGALLRVSDICRDPKTGRGLLPISRATWYNWIKDGRVPPGRKLGENTVAWPIEQVLSLGQTAEA